jgi:hypothetical protein
MASLVFFEGIGTSVCVKMLNAQPQQRAGFWAWRMPRVHWLFTLIIVVGFLVSCRSKHEDVVSSEYKVRLSRVSVCPPPPNITLLSHNRRHWGSHSSPWRCRCSLPLAIGCQGPGPVCSPDMLWFFRVASSFNSPREHQEHWTGL